MVLAAGVTARVPYQTRKTALQAILMTFCPQAKVEAR